MKCKTSSLSFLRWGGGPLREDAVVEGKAMSPDKPSPTVKRAKRLRRTLSKPEAMLWQRLRASPCGEKFRRQHPAGNYVLDFYHARAKLCIEVDGIAHDMGDHPERDSVRDNWLKMFGIRTVRIPAIDVLRDPDSVVEMILTIVAERRA
jgi:very-short-patch-repair endonuclease